MRRSDFFFDSIDLLHSDLHEISLNRSGSYMDSPKWLKNKRKTINPKNNIDKCFQYAKTAALNYEQIKSHPERISKVKSFSGQYDWKKIDFPSHKKSLKVKKRENKVILLMVTDGKK